MVLLKDQSLLEPTVSRTLLGVEKGLAHYIPSKPTLIHGPVRYNVSPLEVELESISDKLGGRLVLVTLSHEIASKRYNCIVEDLTKFPFRQYESPIAVPDEIFTTLYHTPYRSDPLVRVGNTANLMFLNGALGIFIPYAMNDVRSIGYDGSTFLARLSRKLDYGVEFITFDSRSGRGNHLLLRRL